MSSREPSSGILGLLSHKTTYQAVRFLAAHPHGASQAQITTAVGADAQHLLRRLAREGFVTRNGTWDLPADEWTTFALNPRGHELVNHLERLDEWARTRRARHQCL